MQRVSRDFPETKVPVVINYVNDEQEEPRESKQEIVNEITELVQLAGNEVVQVGIAEYIQIRSSPTALNQLLENRHVSTLEADKPVCSRDRSYSYVLQEASNEQNTLFLLLLPLCIVCSSTRNHRKCKVILFISLLATSFLILRDVPIIYALDVSRAAIGADQIGYTGNGVVVAVIDTGIDYNHPDLVPAILTAVDLTGDNNDPMDYDGHGTHVAGIVASQSGTYTGIAPGSKIISLKTISQAQTQDAIQWCIDNRTVFNIKIIQLSRGSILEEPSDGLDPFSMIADDAVEAGMSVVVAVSGCDGDSDGKYELANPEQAFNIIAVGAINDQDTININDDTLAEYSGRGPTGASSQYDDPNAKRPKPDVVAPGDRIWSTRSANASADKYDDINGVYGLLNGTSMAAPHVSGTIALMLEANPNLTPAQVKAILRQTASLNTNLSGYTVNDRGYGIINASAAVELAQNVSNINRSLMHDSWDVRTYDRYWAGLPGQAGDYLWFTIDSPSSTFGISISNIHYYWWKFWGIQNGDHTLLNQISARHVWIDDAYYDLGNDMQEYLFTGPRIYEKGSGYYYIRAYYKVNNVFIEYTWDMCVDQVMLLLGYSSGLSWKTLIYIDPNLSDNTNYPYLPSTSETIYYERNVTGDVPLNVRNLDFSECLKIDPYVEDTSTLWTLRYGYTGNDPNTAVNDEYTYNRDIVIYYQGNSNYSGPPILRLADSLPTPNPPPTTPSTPSGPTSGYTSTTYTYTTNSTDPSEDNIHYEFDWGDGTRKWTDWCASGATAEASHNWTSSGAYDVRVRAQDFNNAWSDWSSSLPVDISTRLTVRTYVIGGSEISDVKVWIDSDPVRYSPVTITIAEGSHTIKVETEFEIGDWLYTFSHWGDGNISNPRNVNIVGDMSLTAHYAEEYIGRCPTLFVWNGTDYAYEALLDIHAESDITIQHNITQSLVKDGFFYKLSLRELDEFTSHIDQVRLYAVDSDGDWHICPLFSAVHSERGWVTLSLRFDDEIRVDLAPTETIELKFTHLGDDIAYFIFEINGHNIKWPG